MSQHIFISKTKDNKTVEVFTGWDRPLQGFFLVVEDVDDGGDQPFFSNLDPECCSVSHPKVYEEFEAFLESMGICLPPGLMDELLEDQRLNVGNKQRTWG